MAAARKNNSAIRKLREQQAIELRIGGATYMQIAEQLDVSLSCAYDTVQRVLRRAGEKALEDATAMVALEAERLDRMQAKLWPQVARGDQGAVDRVLRIMKRRAEMLGLDQPQRQEVTYDFGHLSDDELAQEVAAVLAEAEGITGRVSPED